MRNILIIPIFLAAFAVMCGSGLYAAEQGGIDKATLGKSDAFAKRPASGGKGTVTLSSIPILDLVLDKNSTAYEIDNNVVIDGYYYRFIVRCPHGEYEVTSVRKLIKLCNEIEVLENFRKSDKENHVWRGMQQSFSGIGRGVGRIVLHPGQSVAAIGKTGGSFLRALTSPFRRRRKTKASDGTDRAALGRGMGGGERRMVAYELGLDVYTDNPYAQILIKEVASKRLAGKLPVNIGVFALPGGSVLALSMTSEGVDDITEKLIRDNNPDNLTRALAAEYKKEFGLDYENEAGPLRALLDNPNYTPREQAYIWHYLMLLRSLGGIEGAVRFLSSVNTGEQGSVVIGQLELIAALHKRGKPLFQFVPIRNTLAAISRSGVLCIVISVDRVEYQDDVRASVEASLNAASECGARSVEIWATGELDAPSVRYAEGLGVRVRQNILKRPSFRRALKDNPYGGM